MGYMILTDFKPWVSFTILDMKVHIGLFCQNRPAASRLKTLSLFIFLKNADFPNILHTALTFSNYPLLEWKLPFSSSPNLCRSCKAVRPSPSPQHHWLAVLSESHLPASPDSVFIFLAKTIHSFTPQQHPTIAILIPLSGFNTSTSSNRDIIFFTFLSSGTSLAYTPPFRGVIRKTNVK